MENKEILLKKLNEALNNPHEPRLKRIFKRPFLTIRNSFYHRIYRHFKINLILNPKTKTFYGEKIIITIPPWFDLLTYGVFINESELRLIRFIINSMKDNIIFFDLGANIGYYSLLVSTISNNSQIFAFEPNPDIINILKRNERANIQIITQAVSDSVGTSEFYTMGVIDSGIATLNLDNLKKTNLAQKVCRNINVKTITLDSFCKEMCITPNMVKIDVEGAEERVLNGATSLLKNKNLIVMMEVWVKPFTKNYKNALKILQNEGFNCFTIDFDGSLVPITYTSLPQYFKKMCYQYESVTTPQTIADNLVFKKE